MLNTPATRERRFHKHYLAAGKPVERDEIANADQLGIEVDGEIVNIDFSDLSDDLYRVLVFDGLYDKLTRAVHTAKPKATDKARAIDIINETFEALKSGKYRKTRAGGAGRHREFDQDRFRNALLAGAKAANHTLADDKVTKLVTKLVGMEGKARQKYIQQNFMADPHFKTAWEKPILDKKKAEIKKGERKSAFAMLTEGDEEE
jgi:hypothetical protein